MSRKPGPKRASGWPPTQSQLARLLEEALVDAYGESEELTGLYTMIEDNLELPFDTKVLDLPVTVERIDFNDGSEIVAICRKGAKRQAIPILDLPLPSPRPAGVEWIEAYRFWARTRR
jgi:hypothetical protein